MDPAEVMADYGAAWARDDPQAAFGFYADDVVMHLPGRGALAGTHEGKAAVVNVIEQLLDRTSHHSVEVEVLDQLVSDRHVAMMVREAVERDGEQLELRRMVAYQVGPDAKIHSIDIFDANQYEVDEFFG